MESLKLLDEITLIEILDLHSDEIVDQFAELIEERYDELQYKVEEPRTEEFAERDPITGNLDWEIPDSETSLTDDYDN